jgi:hypothetical protein
MRLRRGETVPALLSAQTPSLPVGGVIICTALTALSVFRPMLPLGNRAAVGAQIITRA